MLLVPFPLSPFFRGWRQGRQPLNILYILYDVCMCPYLHMSICRHRGIEYLDRPIAGGPGRKEEPSNRGDLEKNGEIYKYGIWEILEWVKLLGCLVGPTIVVISSITSCIFCGSIPVTPTQLGCKKLGWPASKKETFSHPTWIWILWQWKVMKSQHVPQVNHKGKINKSPSPHQGFQRMLPLSDGH